MPSPTFNIFQLKQTPDDLKELGNASVKDQKYEEAILHYTHAIKLDPLNYTLHSNRSFAFLKVQQYYYALEDANETIKLNPSWPKVSPKYIWYSKSKSFISF